MYDRHPRLHGHPKITHQGDLAADTLHSVAKIKSEGRRIQGINGKRQPAQVHLPGCPKRLPHQKVCYAPSARGRHQPEIDKFSIFRSRYATQENNPARSFTIGQQEPKLRIKLAAGPMTGHDVFNLPHPVERRTIHAVLITFQNGLGELSMNPGGVRFPGKALWQLRRLKRGRDGFLQIKQFGHFPESMGGIKPSSGRIGRLEQRLRQMHVAGSPVVANGLDQQPNIRCFGQKTRPEQQHGPPGAHNRKNGPGQSPVKPGHPKFVRADSAM